MKRRRTIILGTVTLCAFTSSLALLSENTKIYAQTTTNESVAVKTHSADFHNPVPAPAAAAGFNKLTFNTNFNSPNAIDVNDTGAPGYQWYVDRPFGWPPLSKSEFSVKDGILTIDPQGSSASSWELDTYSVKGHTGHAFKYGYIEVKMRFNPTLGPDSDSWPAFWGESLSHTVTNSSPARFAELDMFEAYTGGYQPYTGAYVGTVHDWDYLPDGNVVMAQNSNNWYNLPSSTNFDQWNTYGVLWKPGSVTWYFDGKPLMTQSYSATGQPSPTPNLSNPNNEPYSLTGMFSVLDSEPQVLILGTGTNWPLQVKWVRVYQNPKLSGNPLNPPVK